MELRTLGTLLNTSFDDGTLAGAVLYDVLGIKVIVPPIPMTSMFWKQLSSEKVSYCGTHFCPAHEAVLKFCAHPQLEWVG